MAVQFGPILGLLESSIKMVDNIMAKRPDYDQKKKEEWLKLRRNYEEERKRPVGYQVHGVIDDHANELMLFINTFTTEIYGKGLPPVPKELQVP